MNSELEKLYKKRISYIKKKGRIITFKDKVVNNGASQQILVQKVQKTKDGSVRILGVFGATKWYPNIIELINSVDWEFINEMESDKRRDK